MNTAENRKIYLRLCSSSPGSDYNVLRAYIHRYVIRYNIGLRIQRTHYACAKSRLLFGAYDDMIMEGRYKEHHLSVLKNNTYGTRGRSRYSMTDLTHPIQEKFIPISVTKLLIKMTEIESSATAVRFTNHSTNVTIEITKDGFISTCLWFMPRVLSIVLLRFQVLINHFDHEEIWMYNIDIDTTKRMLSNGNKILICF